jgi:triacylglycerol lipase
MSRSRVHASRRHRRAGTALCLLIATLMVSSTPHAGGFLGAKAEGPQVKGKNVVLLHGLGRSASNMTILKWRLQAKGYRVCNIDYQTRVDSIEAASDAVFASMDDCFEHDGPIHFVTHSLGGLVLRSMLARHAVAGLGRAVMLAPPNAGSEIADWMRTLPWADAVMGKLAGQLGTGGDDLPRDLPAPKIDFGVIAGDRWINPAGPFLLPAPHDGTVSVASTRLAGMSDHLVVPHTHTFIMNSADVARQIDAFLRLGRFER